MHSRDVADVLLGLIKDGDENRIFALLSQANNIAVAIWTTLEDDKIPEESDHWLQLAINHPAGILAEYWIHSLSSWRRQQHPIPEQLLGEYRTSITEMVTDISPKGRLARSVFSGQISFLLAVDDKWTREHLIPFFDPDGDVVEFQAAWDGFLSWGRLNPTVAETLEGYFLKAVQLLNSTLEKRRERFLEYYTTMFCFQAENPLIDWIPDIFKYGNLDDRQRLANNIENRLSGLEEEKRIEWWNRWLKRYWENRVQGVPSALDAREIEGMLNWLPLLKAVFPEAVNIAIRMPKLPLQHCLVIHNLKDHDIVKLHPESVAKLLLYLDESSPDGFFWYGAKEIIDQIITSGIAQSVKTKLEELRTKLS